MSDSCFHTSPVENRAAIAREGLRPAAALAGANATGVYLWRDLEQHRRLVRELVRREGLGELDERPFDLWQVDTDGLRLEPDRLEPGAHGSCFSASTIPPARLQLLASFADVTAYIGEIDDDDEMLLVEYLDGER